ncbi:hypothetical protein M3J09_012222 [Ascochyta lentis]
MAVRASEAPVVKGGAAATVQTARLLTIPGEIRNRIYELAVEDANAWENIIKGCETDSQGDDDDTLAHRKSMLPRLISQTHHKFLGSGILPAKLEDWDNLRRKYLGLTQTCHQVRQEFLPMYSKIWVGVDALDLDKYVHDFIVQRAQDRSGYTGCIEIGVNRGFVDIRDFLFLLNEASNLHMRFSIPEQRACRRLPGYRPPDLARVLLDAREDYPKFWDLSAEQTHSVRVWNRYGVFNDDEYERAEVRCHHVEIAGVYLSSEFAETWMGEPEPAVYRVQLEAWHRKLGLPEDVQIFPFA